MNQNWPRWIHASIDKYMKTAITTLPVFMDSDLEEIEQQPSRVEISWLGPKIRQPGGNSFVLTIRVCVLVTTIRDDVRGFLEYENQGVGLLAVPKCIPVYKYGNLSGDDNTQLGTLVRQDPVTEYMVGHQERTNRIRQVGIETGYRMDL